MKALIDPNNRIAQIVEDDAVFEVHPSLHWVDCPNDTKTNWSYDSDAGFTAPVIVEPTAEEKLKELRIVRNMKLSATDWWASSDLTMTAAQTAYRQALRDITDTYTSLDDVVWPEVPNE